MSLPNEYLAVRARVEPGHAGRRQLAIDDLRCAGCISCFGAGRRSTALPEVANVPVLPCGAAVELRLTVAAITRAALALYGLPLTGMLLGASLGALVPGPGDLTAVAGALAGLVAGGLTTRLLRRRLEAGLRRRLEVCTLEDADAL